MNEIPKHQLIQTSILPCKIARLDFSGGHEVDDAHRHNGNQIFLFTKGGGTHMIDFNYYPIDDNTIQFITEDQIHSLNSNDNTEGYVIVFTKEVVVLNSGDKFLFNDFPFYNKSRPPVLNPSKEVFDELLEMVIIMLKEYSRENPFKENILGSFISIFLLKCKNLFSESIALNKIDTASQQLHKNFYNLLEEQFIQYHKVNEYADLLNVTPNHLSETIKKLTGKTAGDIIHERLILEAKRRLLHSSITAKELAYALNFNDPSYFSRFFKANTNQSPEGFRKEIREKYHH